MESDFLNKMKFKINSEDTFLFSKTVPLVKLNLKGLKSWLLEVYQNFMLSCLPFLSLKLPNSSTPKT